MAAQAVIRLDTSRPFSEVRGERCVDDPHYRVTAMQGRMVGKKLVMLPFDANGELVEDDGRTEPYTALNVDAKPVTHQPLYNADMRALVERLQKKAPKAADAEEVEDHEDGETGDDHVGETTDNVNLVSWLKGEAKYTPQEVRAAVKARYHVNHQTLTPVVVHLVDDEKLVPREQVCRELARHLPA